MGRPAGRARGRTAQVETSVRPADPSEGSSLLGRAGRHRRPVGAPPRRPCARSALSSSTPPAPDGGIGHATQAAARHVWPSWARLQREAGGWPRCEAAVACGAWKGLAALYERRSEPGRMERLLPARMAKMRRQDIAGRKTYADGTLATVIHAPRQMTRAGCGVRTDPAVAHGDSLRGRGSRAGQGLGPPRYRCPPGAARARPGGDGKRLEHDRVRYAQPGPALGPEPPDGVTCPADTP